jgi:hypothetical protein
MSYKLEFRRLFDEEQRAYPGDGTVPYARTIAEQLFGAGLAIGKAIGQGYEIDEDDIYDVLGPMRDFFASEMKKESDGGCKSLELQNHTELAFRQGLIRGKIAGLGYEKDTIKIIEGMNRTCIRSHPSDMVKCDLLVNYNPELDKAAYTIKRQQQINIAIHDALRRFALDYVDRWVMYNSLPAGENWELGK